ncbi:MAG: hypothetical protein P9M03_11515 [Candidatus Theseobacter exili]|nr:hypothetical protein [Candidatus Theseobacter exili]
MERRKIIQSREENIHKMLDGLIITENDDSIMYDLSRRYDEGYVRNKFESVSIDIALKKSSGVHNKGEVSTTKEMVTVRYRTSIRDEGIAIWRRGEDVYGYYRWHDDLD